MITPASLRKKYIQELNLQEMVYIHLSVHGPIVVKDGGLRSTLSFIYQNIQHGLTFEYSKHLMPYLSLCAILDQLGICYNRTDKPEPKYNNGIKRALVYFAELDEDDDIIGTICAFRNGLLHNISFTSYDKFTGKYYFFRYNKNIPGVIQNPPKIWDGNYASLDDGSARYTTYINIEKFEELVSACIQKAAGLNEAGHIALRLSGGTRQLYYDYILSTSLPKIDFIEAAMVQSD